jgi:alkaline phosphatase
MKRLGRVLVLGLVAVLLTAGASFATCSVYHSLMTPKYVFYFIGDGMGSPQIHSAEAYLAQVGASDGVDGSAKAGLLVMSQMPVQGMSTTFANNRFITDSAAAGTALACGMKTNVGVISMDATKTVSYKSLAEAAKEAGRKVGIVSSVSIDHATPAVFYAHEPSRNNYYNIAVQLANSGFDYFAGGCFKKPNDGTPSVFELLDANGYVYCDTRAELDATRPGQKVVATTHTQNSCALPYAMDLDEAVFADSISLADFTAKGIELLDNPCGFFMMVEGGKIDWANHANDARASIDDTLAFDAAVAEAVAFAAEHPFETLIVVTADHECGGMALGYGNTCYATSYEMLAAQDRSFQAFNDLYFKEFKAATNWSGPQDDMPADLKAAITQTFGLQFPVGDCDADPQYCDNDTPNYVLTCYELEQLEDAYDRSMGGRQVQTSQEDKELYGGYEALTVTCTHILNHKAGIAFTSYSHTGVPVPVLAMGYRAEVFDGFYDNTDIAKKIARIMRVEIGAVD